MQYVQILNNSPNTINCGELVYLSKDGFLVPHKRFCKNKCSHCGKFCSFIDSGFFQDTACCGVRRSEEPISYAIGTSLGSNVLRINL